MKKVKIITLATYETNMGFRVDIVHNMEDTYTCYEAYLYYKSYGVKDLMFGLSDEDTTLEEFCDIVMGNLAEYIRGYIEDHMEDDIYFEGVSTINKEPVQNWESIVSLMDDDLREQVHAELAPCTDVEFYERYCQLHEEKYGKPFVIN